MFLHVAPPTITRPKSAAPITAQSVQRPAFTASGLNGDSRADHAVKSGIHACQASTPAAIQPLRPTQRPSSSTGVSRYRIRRNDQLAAPIQPNSNTTCETSKSSFQVSVNEEQTEDSSQLSFADTTGNIYHAVAARKHAENAANQLSRRIAYYRAMEDRVLREVQAVKNQLEVVITTQKKFNATETVQAPMTAVNPATSDTLQEQTIRIVTRSAQNIVAPRQIKGPRSRDQFQFLTKQKRLLQTRNMDSARHQKETRKMALERQKLKEELEQQKKYQQKEKIRYEQQKNIESRAVKQYQLLESLKQHHQQRLRAEKEREQQALDSLKEMREEENNIALRLQALQFHQEYIQRELKDNSFQRH